MTTPGSPVDDGGSKLYLTDDLEGRLDEASLIDGPTKATAPTYRVAGTITELRHRGIPNRVVELTSEQAERIAELYREGKTAPGTSQVDAFHPKQRYAATLFDASVHFIVDGSWVKSFDADGYETSSVDLCGELWTAVEAIFKAARPEDPPADPRPSFYEELSSAEYPPEDRRPPPDRTKVKFCDGMILEGDVGAFSMGAGGFLLELEGVEARLALGLLGKIARLQNTDVEVVGVGTFGGKIDVTVRFTGDGTAVLSVSADRFYPVGAPAT